MTKKRGYQKPKETFPFKNTYYRTFPHYVKVKCECGREGLFSMRLEAETLDDLDVIEELKRVEEQWKK